MGGARGLDVRGPDPGVDVALAVPDVHAATGHALYREALEKTRKRYGEASPPVAGALAKLGSNLLEQKKYATAEPLLLAGYEGLKKREAQLLPNEKIRLTEALQRLLQLYDAWGKPEKAAEWRKKMPAIPSPKETPSGKK